MTTDYTGEHLYHVTQTISEPNIPYWFWKLGEIQGPAGTTWIGLADYSDHPRFIGSPPSALDPSSEYHQIEHHRQRAGR